MTNTLQKWEWTGLMATIVIVLVFPLHVLKVNYLSPPNDPEPAASFVGGDKCETCHKEIYGDLTGVSWTRLE